MDAFLRLNNGTDLQTPVHRYTHPETGRLVTLVATMHVGQPSYYTGLRKVIAAAEGAGAVVLTEGARRLPNRFDDIKAAEQKLLDDMHRCHRLEQARVRLLGWQTQLEGLEPPARWEIRDLPELGIIRRVGLPIMTVQVRRRLRMFEWSVDSRRAVNKFRFATILGLRLKASQTGEGRPDPGDEVIVDLRNSLALAGATATTRDAVLIWGTGHVPGIDAGLCDAGFNRTKTEWHTVAVLPTVRAAIWDRVRGRSRSLAGEPAERLEPAESTDRI